MEALTRYLLERVRSYYVPATNPTKVILQVWDKHYMTLRKLEAKWGGGYYKHLAGYYWQISKREDLYRVWVEVSPWLARPDDLIALIDCSVRRELPLSRLMPLVVYFSQSDAQARTMLAEVEGEQVRKCRPESS